MPTGTPPTGPRLVRQDGRRSHTYLLDGHPLPGVTTVLDAIAKPALIGWGIKAVATAAVDRWEEFAQMPPSQRLEELKRAPYAHRDALANRGTEIHRLGERLVHGIETTVPAPLIEAVDAYARWLDEWGIEPIASETPLAHGTYGYAGTADLWARVGARDGMLVLIDLKTGRGVYDETALQLAAYRWAEFIQIRREDDTLDEVVPPVVAATWVAHIGPDSVRTVPVTTDQGTLRTFRHLLEVWRAREAWAVAPLVGDALDLTTAS